MEGAESYRVDMVSIDSLPTEILEYVLQLLSPYHDLKAAMCVCKQWNELGQGIISRKQTVFKQMLETGNLVACHFDSDRTMNRESSVRMAERYSHASVYHDGNIYVFGGSTKTGTSNTTFNDIWRLGLNDMVWQRPIVSGKFPSPKAAATMVVYREEFILFGGYCEAPPSPFFQSEQLFSELHVFSPVSGAWRQLQQDWHPPATAGHSASVSVCSGMMIVCGGYRGIMDCTNDVFVLDLRLWTWSKPSIKEPMPWPRFGHQQVTLDESRIAIVGGRTGPANVLVHTDVWVLDVTTWAWSEITVHAPYNAPPHLWSRASCLTNQKLVFVSKYQKRPDEQQYDIRPANQRPVLSLDRKNSSTNQKPGFSKSQKVVDPMESQNSVRRRDENQELSTSKPSIRPNSMSNRHKQLQMLKKYEQIIQAKKSKRDSKSGRLEYPNPFHVHTLDFSQLTSGNKVTWLPVMQCASATACRRKEIFFYSLVTGRAEVILIGGLRTPFLQVGGITKTTPAETSRDVFVFTIPKSDVL